MRSFKEQIQKDLQAVFFNVNEFAEVRTVQYDQESYTIPVVIDKAIFKDRAQGTSDRGEMVAEWETVIYLRRDTLSTLPRKNHTIIIDDEEYIIAESEEKHGLVTLMCNRYDE